MALRRRINGASPTKKIRIGIRHVLIAAPVLVLSLLFLTATHLMNEDALPSNRASPRAPPPPGESHNGASEIVAGNNALVESSATKNSFHFVVSSDCTSYQRWEVLTQLHSAGVVNQCGRFTWIVSGWYVSPIHFS